MDGARLNPSGFSPDKLAEIPPMLQRVVDAGGLAGAVTLLWRKGEIAQVNAVGWRDIEEQQPMRRDTLFRIASMTKPVTSVAALALMEDGKLGLDDPITRWAPEFSNMRVLDDPQGPLENASPAARDITIDDLLTHRAGLAYSFTGTGPLGKAYEQILSSFMDPSMGPDPWMRALGDLPLSHQPGDRFNYSHATDVLGVIVGRAAGSDLRGFLMERILGPLGMADTDFYVPPEKRDRVARVYRTNAVGELSPLVLQRYDAPPAFAAGGGGLVSTADDYLRFALMLLNKGELDGVRLLKPETVDLMMQNRLTDAQRAIPFMSIPFWAGQGFGLGLSVTVDQEKQPWMGPGANGAFGWPGAFGTWWRGDPANNLVMLYMIQHAVSLDPEAVAKLAAGRGLGSQLALPKFQNLTYAALQD